MLFNRKLKVIYAGFFVLITIVFFQNCSGTGFSTSSNNDESTADLPSSGQASSSQQLGTVNTNSSPIVNLAALSPEKNEGYTKILDTSCKNYYDRSPNAPNHNRYTYVRNDHRRSEPLIVAIHSGIGGGYNPESGADLPNIPVHIADDVNVPVTLILYSLTRAQWQIYGNIKQVQRVYTFSYTKPEVLNIDQGKIIYSYGRTFNGVMDDNDPFATFSVMERVIRPSVYAPLSSDNVLGNGPDFFRSEKGVESTIYYSEKLFNKTPDIAISYFACNQAIFIENGRFGL